MRTTAATVLVLGLCAAMLPAQHANTMSPVRPMPAPANALRFGNVLFPGGIPNHATALGSTVSGSLPYTGVPPGFTGRRPRTVVVPYAVPVYYGGGYYPYGYGGYPQQAPQNITVVVPPQQTPSVVINQTFTDSSPSRPSELREYGGAEPGGTADGLTVYESRKPAVATEPEKPKPAAGPLVRDGKPNIYLLATKDGGILQAIGYWQDGSTVGYVTPDVTVRKVPFADIDLDLSKRLNAQRNLELDLTAR